MSMNLSARIAAANALPLAPSPFSQGLQAEDFRVQVREYGERVRWLQAIETAAVLGGQAPTRAGVVYIEKPLAPEVRVFLYQEGRDLAPEQFGILTRGNMMMSFLPDEIDPVRDDRFVALDRTFTSRQLFTVSGSAPVALNHKTVISVSAMWNAGGVVLASRYAITNGLLTWIGAAPSGDVTLVYKYRPCYEYLGENAHQAFLGTDGARLPGKGPVRLLSAGED